MSRRAAGTYTCLDNWVLELAPTLPSCEGWILLAVARRSNYDDGAAQKGWLMDQTGKSETRVRTALKGLEAKGLVKAQGSGWVLSEPPKTAAESAAESARSPKTAPKVAPKTAANLADSGVESAVQDCADCPPEGIEGNEGRKEGVVNPKLTPLRTKRERAQKNETTLKLKFKNLYDELLGEAPEREAAWLALTSETIADAIAEASKSPYFRTKLKQLLDQHGNIATFELRKVPPGARRGRETAEERIRRRALTAAKAVGLVANHKALDA